MTRKGRRCITLLCLVAVTVGGAVHAAPPVGAGVSFTVGPALLDLTASPGASGTHELTVRNTGDVPLAATVVVEPVLDLAEDHSAVSWLSVSPAEIKVEPAAEQEIAVAVTVPDASASGGRYAKVVITTEAGEPGENAAAIAGQLGVGVLVTVDGEGELIRAAEVAKFAPVLEADGRVGFRALVRNSGNVHLVPRGEIHVAEPGEAAAGKLDLKETTPHLPGATVVRASHGSLPLAPGTPYDATLDVVYLDGEEERHAEAATTFTVDPSLTLTNASLCENLDRGPTLRVGLLNEGTIGLEATLSITVQSASGQSISGVTLPEPAIAWPKETTELVTDLPQRLESGAYVLVVTAMFGAGDSVDTQAPFTIGGLDGTPIPLCASDAARSS